MVCASVRRLGDRPQLCLARPMLFATLECFDRGDLIGAGVRMREAVRQLLQGAAHWYGVRVTDKRSSPRNLAKALRKEKYLGACKYQVLIECIDVGNKLAHCQRIDSGTIRGCISYLFTIMDSEPYCGHERKPAATSYKGKRPDEPGDDDDDSANSSVRGGK